MARSTTPWNLLTPTPLSRCLPHWGLRSTTSPQKLRHRAIPLVVCTLSRSLGRLGPWFAGPPKYTARFVFYIGPSLGLIRPNTLHERNQVLDIHPLTTVNHPMTVRTKQRKILEGTVCLTGYVERGAMVHLNVGMTNLAIRLVEVEAAHFAEDFAAGPLDLLQLSSTKRPTSLTPQGKHVGRAALLDSLSFLLI